MTVMQRDEECQMQQCRFYANSGTCREAGSACSHGVHVAMKPPDAVQASPKITERTWKLAQQQPQQPHGGDGAWRFALCSFNLLADKYARQYRSWLYPAVSASHLDWQHRRRAIVAELAHVAADVICLQEVDRFEDLQADLGRLGYSGLFLQRDGGRRDGCATFWRRSMLRPALVKQLRYSRHDLKDNVSLLVLFEPLTAAAAAADEEQEATSAQPHGEQQQQQQPQDMLSQWLPRRWLMPHALTQAKQAGSSSSGSSSSSHYQHWPADFSRKSAASSSSSSSMVPPDSSCSATDGDPVAAGAAGGAAAGCHHAPEWLQCGLLVANTHIIFTPEKGDVKLGQARLLIQEAADMANYYLQQQQGQQEQQQGPASATTSSSNGRMQSADGRAAEAAAARATAVALILAGDFNAVPHSPMYTFLATGQLDLTTVNRRHVAHTAGPGGSRCSGRGYRGFKKAATRSRRSLDEAAGQQLTQQPRTDQQQQADQQQHDQDGAGAAASEPAAAAAAGGGGGHGEAPAATADGEHPAQVKPWVWSDREIRRAAGCSANELAKAQEQQQQPPEAALTPLSPRTRISKAATAFGVHVAAGAGAAAAARAAAAAAAGADAAAGVQAGGGSVEPAGEAAAGGPVTASSLPQRGSTTGGPLMLRHCLKLRSSYAAVLGSEPPYTSSHSLFMDTCDYVWYTEQPITLTQQQQQQQQQQGASKGVNSSSTSSDAAAPAAAAAAPVAAPAYQLRPVAVLNVVDGLRLPKGLPTQWMGSDHVSLVADFELLPAA